MHPLPIALCALAFAPAALAAPLSAAPAAAEAFDLLKPAAPAVAPDTLAPRFGACAPRHLQGSGFILSDNTHRIDQAAAGFRFRFNGPRRRIVDVFIYPMAVPGSELADSTHTRLVEEEFERGLSEIEGDAERDGRTLDLSFEATSFEVATRQGPAEAYHGRIGSTASGEGRLDEHLVVLGVDLAIVKFRTTTSGERSTEWGSELEALVHELMPQLRVGDEAVRDEAERGCILELPDAFDFRLPTRFDASGFSAHETRSLQSPEGGIGVTLIGTDRPQLSVRLHELNRPTPEPWTGIPDEERLARLEEAFEDEVRRLREGFAGPVITLGEPSDPETFELHTRYGTAPGLEAVFETTLPDGRALQLHLRTVSVENAVIHVGGFLPEDRRADWEAHMDAFLTELGATIFVTRPPPGGEEPGGD